MTTNTTGPAELRRLASAFPEELPQLSARAGALIAAWEADRDLLYSLLAVIHHDGGHYTGEHGVEQSARDAQQVVHADRSALADADAALERAANDLMLSEESFVQMRAKRDDVLRELQTTRAALERARALVPFLRGWIETMQSEQGYEDEGTMAWRSWQDMIAEVENVIAALGPVQDGAR